MKRCNYCKIEKELEYFGKDKTKKDGYQSCCKECRIIYQKCYYIENSDKVKESSKRWRESNPKKNKERSKRWRESNLEKSKKKSKYYYTENTEKIQKYQKKWKEENIEKVKENEKRYYEKNYDKIKKGRKERYDCDLIFKIKCILRSRLHKAIKNNHKTGSAINDLGCSIDDLKIYIATMFQPGMTWENWGKYSWHIDHIIPLDSFDLEDREQFLKAVHYTNLQPLWAEDNLKKSNKVK